MIKHKWIGSLLNFLVPGLGAVYGRNVGKAILTYLLFVIVLLSVRFFAYTFALFLISVALIIGYYLYLIIAGYRGVEKDKVYEPVNFDNWYIYVSALVLHWLLITTVQGPMLDKITPINFARIPTPAMDPGLVIGDILSFEKTKAIERNDVAIFWFPENIKTMYIKRCVALPGDSLEIREGAVLINGSKMKNTPLKFRYLVTTDGSEIHQRVLEKNSLDAADYFRMSSDTFQFFLTEKQAKNLAQLPTVKGVVLSFANDGDPEPDVYPKSDRFDWNADYYGPVYVPKRGDRIKLTGRNIDLYLRCIFFENKSAEHTADGVKVNGQRITTYEFKENYFFMMGDSRHNSLDSRYWGFLPEELVIGKAMYLYWSRTAERIGRRVI